MKEHRRTQLVDKVSNERERVQTFMNNKEKLLLKRQENQFKSEQKKRELLELFDKVRLTGDFSALSGKFGVDVSSTNKRTNEQTNERANERTSERANERTSKRANERTSERANERTSERMFYFVRALLQSCQLSHRCHHSARAGWWWSASRSTLWLVDTI